MDTYTVSGEHCYQGYPVQVPPPGTALNQALPPGAVPAQPSAPASAPLAPPGVAPPPSSTAASYYGTYSTPPYGYLHSSGERWSSYPIPAAEPHPYASYPPNVLYDRPVYGHHPYQQQDALLYGHSFSGPQHAYMPLPPRGSDVTRFRKKRPFLPHQNPRTKNKLFKQPQDNFRGGAKNSQQVRRPLNSDPINEFPVTNDSQIVQPVRQGRADEVPANRMGKKRRMNERGEGRLCDRRKGDKRARPGWNKGKRKKGRKQGGDKSSVDPNIEVKGTSPPVKGVDVVPVTEEKAQEAANLSELHRDVRRRVHEFLHVCERESFQKNRTQCTQEVMLKRAGGDANAARQQDTQVPTLKPVGGDANAQMEDIQGGSQEAAGGVAKAEMQDTGLAVGGDENAEMEDTQGGVQEAAGRGANAKMQDKLVEVGGDAKAEMQNTRETADAHPNAEMQGKEEQYMAKNDVAAQRNSLDAQQADNVDSSQADHMNAYHSNCREQQQLDQDCAAQSEFADVLRASAHIDAVQSKEPHADEANMKKLDIVDILKTDCESAPRLATEIILDLEGKDAQECPGVDELKHEDDNQRPSLESVCNVDKKQGKHPEAPTQEELKEREEKTFDFITKLFEENKDFRNMYIENCNNGAFECLMCHSKIKKRFSNLVSLVTHASNVLKTKKLPEHRGYGRAVCALFGWDPLRYPKVPKGQISQSRVEYVPGDEVTASLGDGDVCAPAGHAVDPTHAAEAMEDSLGVDAVTGAPVVRVSKSKLRGHFDESTVGGAADKAVHSPDAVDGEPVDGADCVVPMVEVDENAPLGDADNCAPLRDIDSSVQLESIRDVENCSHKGGTSMMEFTEGWKEQAMVLEDVESEEQRSERVEEAESITELQTGSEVIQSSVVEQYTRLGSDI